MQRKTLSELCAERKALRLRQKELETRKRAIPRITEDPTVEVDSRMSILYANGFRASVAQRLLRSLSIWQSAILDNAALISIYRTSN